MLALPMIWLANAWRATQNGWRRLLRRRVDYVQLELRGELPEFAAAPAWWRRRLLGANVPISLMDLRRKLQRTAADPHVRGVVLVAKSLSPGWATAQSLREEIRTFQRAGKRVVAYFISPDTRSYYALSVADELLMPPTAMLNLLGLRVEAMFLKDTLALAGIEAEVTAVSPHKSAGEQFTRSNISPENREQLDRLLDQRYATLVDAIAADRRIDPVRVRELFDLGPYIGHAARDVGLIDGLRYEDELEAHLEERTGDGRRETRDGRRETLDKMRIQEWDTARKALRVPYLKLRRKYVAVVSVEGAISAGSSRNVPLPVPLIGGQMAGSDSIAQALRQVERNHRIAGLVLHVDSPGGDAFASDLIWREVLRVQRTKPVVVAMGNVAASGGYYVSACANAIVAQPSTITGSIGVISLRPVAAGLLERLQVNTVVLTRGSRTGLLSATLPPTDDERRALRDTIFAIYDDFKRVVKQGRNLSEEQLEPIAGGRVWTGSEAIRIGLVDALGGLPQAIMKAQELAEIEVDSTAPVMWLNREHGRHLPPLPFPSSSLADIGIHELIQDALKTRILAALPFTMREI